MVTQWNAAARPPSGECAFVKLKLARKFSVRSRADNLAKFCNQ